MKYFVEIDGSASGPHDIVDLLHLSKNGVITEASLSKPDDDSKDWKPMGELLRSIARVAETTEEVCVSDIDMKFGSMVTFMVKWAFAAIPAIFVLSIVAVLVYFIANMILSGSMGH